LKNDRRINLKKEKAFKRADILVYFALVVLIVALFVFFVFIPSGKTYDGFYISVNGKKVAVYNYGSYSPQILDNEFNDKIVYDKSNNTITVYFEEHGYNVIKIDERQKSAKVIDANCSVSKDCVYTPSLKGDSAIVCVPHKLKISGLVKSTPTPPTTGGVR
jgi:hypothetical protein